MSAKVLTLKEKRRIEKENKFREQRRRLYKRMKDSDLEKANIHWEHLVKNEQEITSNLSTINNEVFQLTNEKILMENLGDDKEEFHEHLKVVQSKLEEFTTRFEEILEKKADRTGLINKKSDLMIYEGFVEDYMDIAREIVEMNLVHVNIIILIATQVRDRLRKEKKDV